MKRRSGAIGSGACSLSALAVVVALLASAWSTPASAAEEARRVRISEIAVTGNTLLSPAAIDAVLARYKGDRSIAELMDAASTLQAMYRQAGYGAVVVYLPEQALAEGRLTLAVLEGRITRVTVMGHQRFSANNVRRALPQLQEGRTPQVGKLDAQVQLANENPSRRIALTLEAGDKPGEVDARVSVIEDAIHRFSVTADNTGNVQTGRVRLGLAYQNANLFDQDQQLALQAQFAPEHPGAVRLFSAGYRVPLYGAGLMLGAYASYSNVDAGSTATAAGALQFNGKGRVLGGSVARLFERIGEFEQRLTLSLDMREYLNNCAIEGLPIGACGIAGESVTVHPLTLEWTTQRSGGRPLAVSLSASHNLALGGNHGNAASFEAVRPGARRGYSLLRGAVFASLALPADWRLGARVSGQVTGDGLVAGEQFGLAGAAAVRGYEEREITGDSGAVANVELSTPDLLGMPLRLLAFGDGGVVRNRLGTFCNAGEARCTLASAGMGARYSLGPVQLRLDVARASRAGRVTDNHATRVHFQASVAFQ